MTITDAKVHFGLIAGATPAGTNVSNNVQVGEALTTRSYTIGTTQVYSFKVAGAAAGNVATWTVNDNATAQTTGLPVITDGDGNDFEGVDLSDNTEVHAVLIHVTTADTTSITIAGTLGMAATLKKAGDFLLVGMADDTAASATGTITITFGTGDGVVECVGLLEV